MQFNTVMAVDRWIDRLRMRSQIGDEDAARLRELPYEVRMIDANRDFVRLGEQTTHACLVADGLVGRFSQTAGGQRQIVSLHIPGDMVDLHSVVLQRSSSALQALSATTILRVVHGAVEEVAARSPAVARALWRDCVVDAMVLGEWVQNIGRRSARARLAHLLCELAFRNGAIGHDPRNFPMPATQMQLSDACGLTSVHVNRTMRRLSLDGIVDITARHVHVHDWRTLAVEGDFDTGYLHLPAPVVAAITGRLTGAAG